MTRAFVIFVVATMLSAGVVSTADAEQTAALDPCKLVTGADARAVLGTAVRPSLRPVNSEFRVCVYQSQNQSHPLVAQVETRKVSKAGFLKFEKVALLCKCTKTISGLGTSAVYVQDVLVVWRHGNEARFVVDGFAPPLAREIKLAKRALPRM